MCNIKLVLFEAEKEPVLTIGIRTSWWQKQDDLYPVSLEIRMASAHLMSD